MGTSALMSLGVRAMFASFAQLQVTGHNIANAGVDGYSRQQAELANAKGQFTGAGFFGKGVDVVTVSRVYDAFLTREAANASSLAAMDRTRFEQLTRLEEVFPMGERGLGYAAQQLFNAFADLSLHPKDLSTREVVLARAGDLVARFNLASRQLEDLQAGVTQDLKHSVDTVNEIAQRIADVNQQIAMVKGLGQPPNDLLDQRDRLVQQLSGYLQVSTIAADDGTLGVFIAGGQRLVLGNQAQPLQVVPDSFDPSRSALAIVEAGGTRPLTADLLTGGSMSGLLLFQNEDVVAARTAIGQLALASSSAINAQHVQGWDLNGTPGTAVFGSLSPTLGLAAAANTGTGVITVNVSDASKVKAEEYELRYDGATWHLVRADGSTPSGGPYAFMDAALGLGVNITALGLTIQRSGVAVAADRFLLRPVSHAAGALQLLLSDPQSLAAATPPLPPPPTDNGNALALAGLRDEDVVDGHTITDAYASAMAGVGVRVQGARTAAQISAGVAEAAEQQRAAKSGVNLDEEAARLIQFQQAYQAAAKVLQVAQSVFDTLLSTAAR